MGGLRAIAVAALAALAAAAPPAATPEAFPGPIQPDPGTGFASSRRGYAAVFAASFRESGDRYDPAATPTVFLWDRREGALRQITASGPSDQPSVENGTFYLRVGSATEKSRFARTVVAFRSTANPAGKNADGSPEIFVWDSQGGSVVQITDAAAGASSNPVIGARFNPVRDANGLPTGLITVRYRVAFVSTSNLAGDNAAGLPQVFVYDSGLPEVDRLEQVTHSSDGAALPPAIDGVGDRVAFVHDGGLVSGLPGPGVFTWDRPHGVRPVREVAAAAEPALDSTGRWLAWTEGGSVELADLARRRAWRMDPSAGAHRSPALGKGGDPLVALSSDPGDGGAPVAERPVEIRRDGRVRPVGLPGGAYGTLRASRERRFLFLTSTEDLDGSNAEGREVLFTAGYRP
jgi:hypothetical protein